MAIDVLEGICALSLTRRKQRLHLLSWMQGQAAPSRSGTGRPAGTDLTITHGKLHLDERFAGILDGCPARTDPLLGTGNRLGLPIDGEVREIIASLRLIPVGLEGGANQVHSIVRLRFDEIIESGISRIHEMLIWKKVLLSQINMDCGDDSLITTRSRTGLDMSSQLWSIFVARLGEMHLVTWTATSLVSRPLRASRS